MPPPHRRRHLAVTMTIYISRPVYFYVCIQWCLYFHGCVCILLALAYNCCKFSHESFTVHVLAVYRLSYLTLYVYCVLMMMMMRIVHTWPQGGAIAVKRDITFLGRDARSGSASSYWRTMPASVTLRCP